jgi:ketosteroid isomerase-like protein
MRTLRITLILATAAGFAGGCRHASAAPPATASDDSTRAEITRLERAWAQAPVDHDADKMASLMADDYVEIILNAGVAGKPQRWSVQRKSDWIAAVRSSRDKYESVVLTDINVYVQGDIASVTGYYTQRATRDGKDNSASGAYVDTWVRRGGHWLVVNSVFP